MGDGGDSPSLVPRLCHIVRWVDFNGYGFNLHAEKGKAGQFIGKVDDGSPAEAAGLKPGDRIVEVNGTNIGNENHQQVVGRIKAGGDETRLLVVDSETDQHYKDEKKVVRGDLPEVKFLTAARDDGNDTPQIEDGVPAAVIGDTNGTEPEDVSSAQIAADDSSQYVPRLCNLCKWPNFDGYGFNLHAEKDKPGQYIGLVDADSPAEVGGLREGDRIIEVNGDNIESFNHTVVIQKIKSGGDKTSMLVVDKATDDYYKSRGQTVASSMANVMVISTPSRDSAVSPVVDTALEQQEAAQVAAYSWQQEDPPAYPDDLASGAEQALPDPPQHGEWDVEADSGVPEPNVSLSDTEEATESVRAEVTEAVESAPLPEDSYIVHNGTEEVAGGVAAVAVADDDDVVVAAQQEVQESVGGAGSVEYNAYEEVEVTASPPDPTPVSYQEDLGTAANGMNGGSVGDVQAEAGVVSQTSQAEPAVISTPSSGEDLNLNLSAAEMKERLKSRKKQDPRQSKTSFETKYKMFEKM